MAVGAAIGAASLMGCGVGLETDSKQEELMPAAQDAGTVTPPGPQGPDLFAGGIAEYPPTPPQDGGVGD